MGVPRFAGKHEHDEFLTPAQMCEWRRARNMLPERAIDSAVILYQDLLYNAVPRLEETTPLGGRACTPGCTPSIAPAGGWE